MIEGSSPKRLPRVNAAEESFRLQWRCRFGPVIFPFERNYRFHPSRRWEIDFAWWAFKVGLEIQGGIWIGGAHARPMNIERDMEKHNALLDLGWRVWHVTPKQVKSGIACQHMERVLLSARRGEACVMMTGTPGATRGSASRPHSGELFSGSSSSEPPF